MPAASRLKWIDCPSYPVLCQRAATFVADAAKDSIRRRGKFIIALAGGSTPAGIYDELAGPIGSTIPWSRVHIFLGDERFVPLTSPRSNYRMIKEHLLDRISIPTRQVHPVPVNAATVDKAASLYEGKIRSINGNSTERPRFDMMMLGMGEDGHTASLFPHHPALNEDKRWVVPVQEASVPEPRVTFTLPLINHARRIIVAVRAEGKADVLNAVRKKKKGLAVYPIQMVSPRRGSLTWLLA